ncbi:MAG: DMT family transporter [Firmicutes bacterium]|nr:DMT family transporter [Bacillota bacterium]
MIRMNERTGEVLVAVSICLRATSLLFGKIALRTMGPFLLMGTRFLVAFVVIGLLFRKTLAKATGKEVLHSAVIGLMSVLAIGFELKGLSSTDTSVTAFLEGTVVIMVPVITCILTRTLPGASTVVTGILSLAGVALMTLKGGVPSFSAGELMILFGTFWYAMLVILTDRYAKSDNASVIAVLQMFFIALFAFAGAFMFEEIRIPQGGDEWMSILALALVCSGVGFTLQPIGQKYTTPERAGLISLLNPVTAAILGIVFLGEEITLNKAAGALMIILSIVIPALSDVRKAGRKSRLT